MAENYRERKNRPAGATYPTETNRDTSDVQSRTLGGSVNSCVAVL